MRLVLLSCLALASAACATQKPAEPSPGAFERVADRLSDPAYETSCLLSVYCHGRDYNKRRLEQETDRNPADRRDRIVVNTALGDQHTQRVIRQDKANERPADDPKPNLPHGATSADTPNP